MRKLGCKQLTVAGALALAFVAALPAGARAQFASFTPVTFILHNSRTDPLLVSISNRLDYGPFGQFLMGMYPGQIDLIQQWINGIPEGHYGDFIVRFHSASSPPQSYCEWRATASRSASLKSWICNLDSPTSQGGALCEGTYGKDTNKVCYFQFTVK